MQFTRLADQSRGYLRAREELRVAEVELMRPRDQVADMRRQLPQGPVVSDYVFQEGPASLEPGDAPVRDVRLTDLFTDRSSSTTSCTTSGRRVRARCARCGTSST